MLLANGKRMYKSISENISIDLRKLILPVNYPDSELLMISLDKDFFISIISHSYRAVAVVFYLLS